MACYFHSLKSLSGPVPSVSKGAARNNVPALPSTPAPVDIDLTDPELRSRRMPIPGHWQPQQDYEYVSIGELAPGPRRVVLTARIVNLHDQVVHSKMQKSAQGCLKILCKDDSALMLINLWYGETIYDFGLGSLLTIWTTHVSSPSAAAAAVEGIRAATLMTSVFPEGDASCHVHIVDQADTERAICNTPLGYVSGRPLLGLISLKAFLEDGGDEMLNAKILVCVHSIGTISTFTSRQGQPVTTLSVCICDQSTEATLSICHPLIPSAQGWEQYRTTLLISSPGRQPGRKLSIKARTLVEVDPDIDEAAWVRRWVQRENCPVNEHFPANLFDIESTVQAPLRLQFTLASLDSFIRASPWQTHTGYLSVILTSLNIVSLCKRGQLFSMECCGVPIYANARSSRCEQCGTSEVHLRINPNLVAEMADETGAVSSGVSGPEVQSAESPPPHTFDIIKKQGSKILWTDEAWTQLLGRNPEQLAALCETVDPAKARDNFSLLRYLEQRLMFMRVILVVGWTGDQRGGRLAVLSVVG